ncbi:hypothetical protein [Nonomuraea cypriaca]|nr:hypothetical protein [Nonomuraea cypriaca]
MKPMEPAVVLYHLVEGLGHRPRFRGAGTAALGADVLAFLAEQTDGSS